MDESGRYVEIVNALLAKGANVNKAGYTGVTAPLWASQEGYVEIVKALLAKGAKIDVKIETMTRR